MLLEPESELVLELDTWLADIVFLILIWLFDKALDSESIDDFSAVEVP